MGRRESRSHIDEFVAPLVIAHVSLSLSLASAGRNNRRYPEKSCRFFLQQNFPASPRAVWVVRRPRGSRRLGNARSRRRPGEARASPNKCRRLCFNCGVCSPAFYKCPPFCSVVSLPPPGVGVVYRRPTIAKNHPIARTRMEILSRGRVATLLSLSSSPPANGACSSFRIH